MVGGFAFQGGALIFKAIDEEAAAHVWVMLSRIGQDVKADQQADSPLCKFCPETRYAMQLAENVFDLVEERRTTLGRLIVDFLRGVELLEELALFLG